jgi:hypothetical protein
LWELRGDTYVQVVDVAGVVSENRGDLFAVAVAALLAAALLDRRIRRAAGGEASRPAQ